MKGDQLFCTFLSSFECCAVLMHHVFRDYNFLDNYFRKKSNFFETQELSEYFLQCNTEAFPLYSNGLIIS